MVYALFTVFLTWPLLPHLGSAAYLDQTSPHGGDLSGSIAQLRELVDGRHNPFAPGRQHDFDAPSGLGIRWALNLASFSSNGLLYLLALAFGATVAYGVFTVLGYAASGLAMFLLVRHLTRDSWIALVCGWAFAFYPFVVVTGEHPQFVHGWVFVVMFWRFLRLYEEPSMRNGVWAGLASILALSWTQQFILIGGIALESEHAFQSDDPRRVRLQGAVDHAHSAPRDFFENIVVADAPIALRRFYGGQRFLE